MKKSINKIMRFVAIAVLCLVSVISGQFNLSAFLPLDTRTVYAEQTDGLQEEYESVNVLDDLKNSTVDGKKFNLSDYNFDENKKLQIFSFVEFCYSFYANKQDVYGLYVYVYNPQGLKFEQNSTLHRITLRNGDYTDLNFFSCRMEFLNCSQGDYYGLFYKFKVVLSDAEKNELLQGAKKVNSTARRYEIGEIQLKRSSENNASSYAVGIIYKFSGYAKGFGANEEAESTLTMVTEGDQEVISLNVKPTFYRPEGTNGKNDYTQDSLHSVYFAVPNHFIDKYGEMYAVHATWLNAVLKPMLVTGNQGAYNAISNYLGKDVLNVSGDDFPYAYAVHPAHMTGGDGPIVCEMSYHFGKASTDNYFNVLYGLFYSGNGADSADSYVVSGEDIYAEIKKSATQYGGELVNGKFSKAIFESIDESFTELNITRDEEFPLSSQKLTQNWWQKIFGIPNYTAMQTENVSAIEKVTDDKLTGNKDSVCKSLYISTTDYDDFVKYYDTHAKSDKNDYNEKCTVYLFRYMVSDYISREATLLTWGSHGALIGKGWDYDDDTNAYFFQETVNLDFDIIDLTFLKGDVYTVIPVAMSPIDIVHSATAPVYTTSDKTAKDWWKIILGLIALIVLLLFLMPVLPTVINFILQVLFLPFKLLGKALNKINFKAKSKGNKAESGKPKSIDGK